MNEPLERTIELLQQLGLKQYEARAFVALSRLGPGTAKDVSEISDVPRSRVYDAIRVLESKGLVAIQHSNPQVFSAVETDEAVEILRSEYEQRVASLRERLGDLEPAEPARKTTVAQDIWALSGSTGIVTRSRQLIDSSEEEVVLVIAQDNDIASGVKPKISEATARGVELVLATPSADHRDTIRETFPSADVVVTGLQWLHHPQTADDDTDIGFLLLVDREALLVSTVTGDGHPQREQAVFGRGVDNGVVAVVRRMLTAECLDDGR